MNKNNALLIGWVIMAVSIIAVDAREKRAVAPEVPLSTAPLYQEQ